MKKIIFETIGNSVMVMLFAASIIEFFSINAQYTQNGFQFTAGKISSIFIKEVLDDGDFETK